MGFCMFRSKFFTDDTKGLYHFVCEDFNRYPSLIPPMTWASSKQPAAPSFIKVNTGINTTIEWGKAFGEDVMYNIYCSDTYPVDVNKAENILAVRYRGNSISMPSSHQMFYAVTTLDRYGNESKARQMPTATLPKDIKPGWWWVTHPLG